MPRALPANLRVGGEKNEGIMEGKSEINAAKLGKAQMEGVS